LFQQEKAENTMQLTLNIHNGKLSSLGNAGPIRSLEDARVSEEQAAAEKRFAEDYSTITSTLKDLASLDNGTEAVTKNSRGPVRPEAPGLFDSLFSKKAKEEYKQALARHSADTEAFQANYAKGGKDLAPEAGVVVSKADQNRFGANAELQFDAAGLQQNGDLLTGLERAQVEIAPSESRYYDEVDGYYRTGVDAGSTLRTLSYEKTGDKELYRWTAANKDAGNIAIDHKTGVLTYFMNPAPEERVGFMDM
jgi:hypothetical protein